MKKLAIGCGIALLVLIVVVGAGGFFLWNRYVRPMTGAITQLSQVADIEKDVRNTSSFAAPSSGELNDELVGRFVRVQEAMQQKLGSRMAELKAKYDEIDRSMKSERRQASFGEAMTALKDLSGLLVEAKRAQVDALNQAGFSVREYEWVRQQVYAAVGIVPAAFDVKDIQRIAREAGKGEAPQSEPAAEVPERNRQLVAPHEEKLKEWAPFAFFGL